MFLASKMGWAGIAFTLLTAGMSLQGFPRNAAGSDSDKEGVASFVIKNEIMKMQETLRNKGQYRGKIDGVFGLQTRASIRAYQKTQNLPITGKVDSGTANGLGVRPESTSESSVLEVGHGSERVGGDFMREKPSAGVSRAHDKASKIGREGVSRAVPR